MLTNVLLSQSPPKNRNHPESLRVFVRPIIACSWQFIVLVMLIAFITWTESTTYRVVPTQLAALFVQYPQGATAATTLVGSLLSLISTKCVSGFPRSFITDERDSAFSEAIRFATVVSLASPGSKNMSLYSLYARISIGSVKILFDFGRNHVHWRIISLISLLLFTIQTTAMIATIVIILTSLSNAKHLDLDHIASFNEWMPCISSLRAIWEM